MKKYYSLIFLFVISYGSFGQINDTLRCIDYKNPYASNNGNTTAYYINSAVQEYNGGCNGLQLSGMAVAIIDSLYCLPINNCNKNFGQINTIDCANFLPGLCRPRAENYFLYSFSDSSVKNFSHLLDSIGNGYHILCYTWSTYAYSQLDSSFVNSFKRLGSVLINTLPDSTPFIFFCQKGHSNSVTEIYGTTSDAFIMLSAHLNCAFTNIDELANENSIKIYPNPLTSSFTLQLNTQLKDADVIIYDMLGKEMLRKKITGNRMEIEKGSLVSGVYFVRVRSEERQWVEKIIVE